MNPFERLEYYKDSYTKSEKVIYTWIKENPTVLIKGSIDIIAEETSTSKAAMIRFSKKIGYNGFAEFKFELSRYIIAGGRQSSESKEELDTVRSITSLYSGYIRQINDCVDLKVVQSIVAEMNRAKRVKIIGRNRTGFSASQFRYRLSKIGFDAEAITDSILLTQIQDSLGKDDLVILFSTQAKEKAYYDFCKSAMKNGTKVVIISCANTSLLKLSHYHIVLPSISSASYSSFLDDQAIIFILIEILLAELAYITTKG